MKLILIFLVLSKLLFAFPDPYKYLKIVSVTPIVIHEGELTGETVMEVIVSPGLRIQANPASDAKLLPTFLKPDTNPNFELVNVDYPKGKPFRLETWPHEVATYEGTTSIRAQVRVKKTVLGNHQLNGQLRFQPCTEKRFLFPASIPFSIPIVVSKQ